MTIEATTKCLLYKQVFEDNLHNKSIDSETLKKAKDFICDLTGISFSDEELKDKKFVNRIVNVLNEIQRQITEFRTQIKL